MNWSVYEWEKAHKGDHYYMLRTGDDKAGIVFRGVFTSDPYPGEDWAGNGKKGITWTWTAMTVCRQMSNLP